MNKNSLHARWCVKAFIPLVAELLIYSIFYNFLPDLFGMKVVTVIVG